MRPPKHVVAALTRTGLRTTDVRIEQDGKSHIRLTLPNGRRLTCALTPSDGNAHRQIARDIQRCIGERGDWTNQRGQA